MTRTPLAFFIYVSLTIAAHADAYIICMPNGGDVKCFWSNNQPDAQTAQATALPLCNRDFGVCQRPVLQNGFTNDCVAVYANSRGQVAFSREGTRLEARQKASAHCQTFNPHDCRLVAAVCDGTAYAADQANPDSSATPPPSPAMPPPPAATAGTAPTVPGTAGQQPQPAATSLPQGLTIEIQNGLTACAQNFQLNGQTVPNAQINVVVPDWHALQDNDVVMKVLNAARDSVFAHCVQERLKFPNMKTAVIAAVGVGAHNTPFQVVSAWWYNGDAQWRITQNFVSQLVNQENQKIEAQRQQAEAAKQAEQEAQAKERIRQAALADCGPQPSISGGPWFSSTYKTAAADAARNERFLCVKIIEYVGPAVNPFGGNAARAKFTGYAASTFQPLSAVMDFPY